MVKETTQSEDFICLFLFTFLSLLFILFVIYFLL